MKVSYRNRSRVSIRVTKISARAGGVVDPVKFFLTSSLISVQNLVVSAHVGNLENFGAAGAARP